MNGRVGDVETIRLPQSRRWVGATVQELAVAIGAVLLYFLVRGLSESSVARAHENGHHIVRFERWLGISWEERLQDATLDHEWLVTLLNWIYIYGHWPVIAAVAVWLLVCHRSEYVVLRNAFLISGAIGLVCFASFPVAPPRLLDGNLVDTITEQSRSYRVLQPPVFVNQYAAMPSLHVGWDLLIGIVLVRTASRVWLRAIGVMLPIGMFTATVLTANHYIVDGIAGAVVALFGLFCAYRLRDWSVRRVLASNSHGRRGSADAPQ